MDDLAEAYGLGTWLCPIVKGGWKAQDLPYCSLAYQTGEGSRAFPSLSPSVPPS